ncbi:MAG: ABC transporter ATP-binding protein [Lentisphaeria bacterium]|nr:ABC transporter ATP-binding protein [Lentisphaeria bacterium]
MDEYVIHTEKLTKDYSSWFRKTPRPALDQLTISIPKGCVFGFLGPNGAGKTTTIKILMGLIRPTGGTALVLNKPYDDVESKNRIGFLPDSPAFTPTLSAYEFLDVCARLLKIPSERRRKRVDEVLEIVRMSPHAKSKIGTFSRGMLQRIGIAQAILNEPELLILDEPLLGLDPYGRQEFKEIILGQKNDFHASVFFSSHILSDVEEICDSISILNRGRLLCSGPLSTLLSGGGSGITVDVRSEDALRELLTLADQIRKTGPGEWELLFQRKDPELEAKIDALSGRYGELVKIRSANETLDSFFFKKIEADNAKNPAGETSKKD